MKQYNVSVYSVGGGSEPTWYCIVDEHGRHVKLDGSVWLSDDERTAKIKANNLNRGIEDER